MKASAFEYRHQTFLHLILAAVALATYLIDRDDIVWALVRARSHPRLLERALFALATLLIGAGAALRTYARARPSIPTSSGVSSGARVYLGMPYPFEVGSLLFAIGVGFLLPPLGFAVLVAGEAVLAIRLIRRKEKRPLSSLEPSAEELTMTSDLGSGFCRESGKWGLFVTMIVFTCLLNDRVAEILAAVSVVVWAVLNFRLPRTAKSSQTN